MKLNRKNADILVPDGCSLKSALARTTHLGVGAHQDDLEIIAAHGILECFGRKEKWFTGITCTDGSGSTRAGIYADHTDNDIKKMRLEEQRTAARIGRYSSVIQLGYTSKEAKSRDARLEDDLVRCFKAARPKVVYTHNPADKHPTHVAISLAVIAALRRLPLALKPRKVYGCEVWRSLDWLPDDRKVPLNLNLYGRESFLQTLLAVFESQIAGGKRYDLATMCRWKANATYLDSRNVDTAQATTFAMDLTPLIKNSLLDIGDYVLGFIDSFHASVKEGLRTSP